MAKKIILAGATCFLSLAFWFKAKPWTNDPLRFQDQGVWLWPLILLIVFSAVASLSFLLLPRAYRFVIMAVNFIVFVLFFGYQYILLGGIAISFLFQLSALSAVDKESANRLKFNLASVIKPSLCRLVTSLLVLVSFAYFLSSGVQASAQKNQLPPSIQRTVQIVVGNYFGNNLEIQNSRLRAEASSQVISQINSFLKPYFKFLPPLLAFGLFLVLQGLSAIFIWLSVLVVMLLFFILKVSGLIKMEKQPKEAEVLVF